MQKHRPCIFLQFLERPLNLGHLQRRALPLQRIDERSERQAPLAAPVTRAVLPRSLSTYSPISDHTKIKNRSIVPKIQIEKMLRGPNSKIFEICRSVELKSRATRQTIKDAAKGLNQLGCQRNLLIQSLLNLFETKRTNQFDRPSSSAPARSCRVESRCYQKDQARFSDSN